MTKRAILFLSLTVTLPIYGTPTVSLSPLPVSPQPVGTQIQWTATASDTQGGTLVYQWQVSEFGGAFHVVRDFYITNVFSWMPLKGEGSYQIEVIVQNQSTGNTAKAVGQYVATSNVIGATPVVQATSHPLVALYSAPPCPSGDFIHVIFQTGSEPSHVTPWKPCAGTRSENFLVAGMRANTRYSVVQQIEHSGTYTKGPMLAFITGPLPTSLPFPAETVMVGPDSNTATQESVILQLSMNVGFQGAPTFPIATDLSGQVLWYYAPFANSEQNYATLYRPIAGGAIFLSANDTATPLVYEQIFREVDLLGNTLRETNIPQVSKQLVAMGKDPITSFNHDAIQLPNGHLILIASNERLLTNVQGPGTVDVLGDMLVELDTDLQVVWSWNAFDHLDNSRKATLGEICTSHESGCPTLTLASVANDWLHSNSVYYDSKDGNLIVSVRHQDWVIKIDYKNGTGTGNVVWRMGIQGDFTISPPPTDPYPWFTHQHDSEYVVQDKPIMAVFDNGNTHRTVDPTANSRGQVYRIDETTHTVDQVVNADLGTYSMALGRAQVLKNGNFSFSSGIISATNPVTSQSVEVLQSGTIDYILQSTGVSYRDFRMYSLYQP